MMTRQRMGFALWGLLSAVLLFAALIACGTPAPAPAETPAPAQTPTSLPADTPEPVVETVEIGKERIDPHAEALTLSLDDAQEVFDALAALPALRTLTLNAPALSPDEIASIRMQYPDLQLLCDVALNGQTYPSDSAALDLSDVPEAGLASVLSAFPALNELTLGEASPAFVQGLLAARANLRVVYRYCRQVVSPETESLDLSGAEAPDAGTLDALLATAPKLNELFIGTPDDAATEALLAVSPRERGIVLHGTLTLLDTEFAADAARIDFARRKVSDEETAEIERMLPLFTNLEEIDLFESRLRQETMDHLFDTYPEIFFGWTFEMWNGYYVERSDITAFCARTARRRLLTEEDYKNLRYCKHLLALDFGHSGVKNLDFLRNWPQLRILIVADTNVTDLTPIADLQELQYLELFLTTPDSYEPLTHLTKLLDLNLCHTKKEGNEYRDDDEILLLTQIKSLERLWISKTLTAHQAQLLREGLPGVEFDFSSNGSTDKGWREHPRYFIMRKGFTNEQFIPFE